MCNPETLGKPGEFREPLKETDWAWIAGFIDGEGCITITRTRRENWHKHHEWSQAEWIDYRPRLSVHNTNEESIAFLAWVFGANYSKRKLLPCNIRPIFAVEIASRERLQLVLPKLMPYLRVKRELAELLYRCVCLPRGSGPEKEDLWRQFDALITRNGQKAAGRAVRRSTILSQANG